MNGTDRVNIRPGLRVSIVLKTDQQSGKLTEGIVKDILTKSLVQSGRRQVERTEAILCSTGARYRMGGLR